MAYDEPDDPTGLDQVDDMTIGAEVNNDDQQDASDSLEDSATGDPLDTGILPTDRWLAADKFGTTEAEEEAGESLDQHLAEEIPDIDPYAEAEREDEEADTEDDLLEEEDLPDPRAGRLSGRGRGSAPGHGEGSRRQRRRDRRRGGRGRGGRRARPRRGRGGAEQLGFAAFPRWPGGLRMAPVLAAAGTAEIGAGPRRAHRGRQRVDVVRAMVAHAVDEERGRP